MIPFEVAWKRKSPYMAAPCKVPPPLVNGKKGSNLKPFCLGWIESYFIESFSTISKNSSTKSLPDEHAGNDKVINIAINK